MCRSGDNVCFVRCAISGVHFTIQCEQRVGLVDGGPIYIVVNAQVKSLPSTWSHFGPLIVIVVCCDDYLVIVGWPRARFTLAFFWGLVSQIDRLAQVWMIRPTTGFVLLPFFETNHRHGETKHTNGLLINGWPLSNCWTDRSLENAQYCTIDFIRGNCGNGLVDEKHLSRRNRSKYRVEW